MSHYICTGGCKGVSEKPGVCQATECPNVGEELLACDCTDGQHEGAFEEGEDGEDDDEE